MPITLRRRLWWLALAIVPSALLMGVTAHLSVDMPSMPLVEYPGRAAGLVT